MGFDLGELLKDVSKLDTKREAIEYIRLDLIDEDPNNFYRLSDIDELAANIALCGLQQPIRVRPVPDSDRYMIVSGHRRRAALAELRKDDEERWSEAPCIIEQDEASPALQQLRLIYANANTRTMTSAEISEQAVQVEKLLYQLKEDGYEFPGRMRDHVAQAVGASKSKLARLKVIRDNLSFGWKFSWKDGKLPESTAYELAQLSHYHQDLIHAATNNIGMLYAETVREYGKRFKAIDEVRCGPKKDMACTHRITMLEKSCKDRWQDPCRTHCCMSCPSLVSCKSSCEKAAGLKAQRKAEQKAQSAKFAEDQAAREKPYLDVIRLVYKRVGEARAAAGVSAEAVCTAAGIPFVAGERKITTTTRLPIGRGVYAGDAMDMCRVADLLGCSVDYLLGRSECLAVAKSAPDSGTAWQTGNPVAYGTYAAYVEIDGAGEPKLYKLLWDGDEWLLFGDKLGQGVTVLYWSELPAI